LKKKLNECRHAVYGIDTNGIIPDLVHHMSSRQQNLFLMWMRKSGNLHFSVFVDPATVHKALNLDPRIRIQFKQKYIVFWRKAFFQNAEHKKKTTTHSISKNSAN